MDYQAKTVKGYKAIDSTENDDLLAVATSNGMRNITVEEFLAGVEGASVPDATTSVKGKVKQATNITEVSSSADTTITGTSADESLEAVRQLAVETKGKVNELIQKLKTAGIIASN